MCRKVIFQRYDGPFQGVQLLNRGRGVDPPGKSPVTVFEVLLDGIIGLLRNGSGNDGEHKNDLFQ